MSTKFWQKISGLLWGPFSGDSGGFPCRGGEEALSSDLPGAGSFFETYPGTPVPPTTYSPSLNTAESERCSGSQERGICNHYLLKSCIPAIKVDSTLSGRSPLFSGKVLPSCPIQRLHLQQFISGLLRRLRITERNDASQFMKSISKPS